jgi:hypothetical protein
MTICRATPKLTLGIINFSVRRIQLSGSFSAYLTA